MHDTATSLPADRSRSAWAYGVALIVAVVALLLNTLLAATILERGRLLIPLGAVFLAAAVGGWWPGLLVTLSLALATWYLQTSPAFSLAAPEPEDFVWLALFIVVGLCASLLGESLLRTRARYMDVLADRERSLARLDSLFDSAAVGLLLVDRELRITRANWVVAEASGLPIADHIGRRILEVQPGMPESFVRGLQRVLDTGEAMPLVEVALRLPGTSKATRHWLVSATPIRGVDGAIEGLACVRVDITDLRRAESEARQAVSDREDMMAIVSHDLRSPLTAILLNAGYIRRKAPAVARQVDSIERAGLQMQQLIADILDVNRARQGHLTLQVAPAAVGDVVTEAVDTLRPQAAIKGLQLAEEVPPGIGTVMADRRRLLQVLSNLIGNAIKFTPERGTVTVTATVAGAELVLTVSDTGPGIPLDQQAHVFDRFWQSRRAERQGAGSGLGLAIAKGIVEAHHGRIAVRSVPGEGATFTVTLPVHGPPVAVQTA